MLSVSMALSYEVAEPYGIASKLGSLLGSSQAHVDRTEVFIRLPDYFFDRSCDEMVIRPIEESGDDHRRKARKRTAV
jgi:hypothetical protein